MGFWSDFTDYFTADVVPAAVSLGVQTVAGGYVPNIVNPAVTSGLTAAGGRLAGEYVGSKVGGHEFNLGNALTRAGIEGATNYIFTDSEKALGKQKTLGQEFGFKDDSYFSDWPGAEPGFYPVNRGPNPTRSRGWSEDFLSADTLIKGADKALGYLPDSMASAARTGLVNVPFGRAIGAVAPSVIAPLFETPETQSAPRASDQQFNAAQGTTSAVALPSTGQVTPTTNTVEATNITSDVPSLPSGVSFGDDGTGLSSFLVRDRNTGQQRRVTGTGNNFASSLARRAAGGF